MYSSMGGMIGPSAVMTMASGLSSWARTAWNAIELNAFRTRNKRNTRRRDFITCSPEWDYYNGLKEEQNENRIEELMAAQVKGITPRILMRMFIIVVLFLSY
jgi:hypothetical protein